MPGPTPSPRSACCSSTASATTSAPPPDPDDSCAHPYLQVGLRPVATRGTNLEAEDQAGVTQLAECLLPKQDVVGSNPIARSKKSPLVWGNAGSSRSGVVMTKAFGHDLVTDIHLASEWKCRKHERILDRRFGLAPARYTGQWKYL